ncbi:MAG TPA: hypothetical protein VND19_09625 [Acetobacteraceae bacterium]|nr:hypothetical protein [Acetobacteraceae bacterium]
MAATLFILAGSGAARAADSMPGRVTGVDTQAHTVTIRTDAGKTWTLSAQAAQQAVGQNLELGDLLTVTGDPTAAGSALSIRTVQLGRWQKLVPLAVSAIALIVLASVAAGWRPLSFMIGADNRVSNSQVQVVLWFGVTMTVYLATWMLRFYASNWQLCSGIGIPPNLLAMTGLSGLTFAGAKMIAVTKNNGEPPAAVGSAAAATPGARKRAADSTNWRTDLFKNDQGKLDFGDFQMMLIVVLAALIYIVSADVALGSLPLQQNVSLPDVDGSLLAAFGIGQGSYLAKKAALPAGTG